MFNEQNFVENLIRDLLCEVQLGKRTGTVHETGWKLPNGRNRKGSAFNSMSTCILSYQ